MTDRRDILDLIDHVVDEHELLSSDAMRWAPDAPEPTPAAVCTCSWCASAESCAAGAPIDVTGFIRDVTGVQMTPWQQQMLAANPSLRYVDETRVRLWLNDILTEDPR